jgi:hypothetical protein
MNLLVVLLILMLLFGGGGYAYGGPYHAGGGVGLVVRRRPHPLPKVVLVLRIYESRCSRAFMSRARLCAVSSHAA